MKRLILTVIVLIFLGQAWAQGYKIEVKMKQLPNEQLILGHHKNDNLIPDDTITLNSKGYGVFKGKKPLKEGLYFIFLPSKTYFDIIIDKDQQFMVENDTTDLLKNLKITGSDVNQAFADYQIFVSEQGQKMRDLNNQYQAETDKAKKEKIKKQMDEINAEYEKKFNEIMTKYGDSFFATFLKATKEVQIPDSITDRREQYLYYKNHYFDNFDVSDARLLYTPFYEKKIDFYLDKLVVPDPDSINAACDWLLTKAQSDPDLYKYMLIHLFNKYARSQMMIAENVYVHLADIYIEKATWSTDSFKNELKTKLVRKKNCLIGNQAKPLRMSVLPKDSAAIENLRIPLADIKQRGLEIEKDTSRTFDEKLPDLSQLVAEYLAYFPDEMDLYNEHHKYTILWFMTPECSHCRHDTPLFYKEFNDKLKNVDVVVWSIFMEGNLDNWAKFTKEINDWYDFVEKHHFYSDKWYNVWNPFANYRFKYDISSSPVLYLLDENKKIIAKRIGYEQAIEIIQDLEKEQ